MVIIPKKNLAKRYYSNVMDYAVIFFFTFIYIHFFGHPNKEGGYSVTGFKALGIPFVWFLYFPVCESMFGRTLGKVPFHLLVMDEKGNRPSLGQAFMRRMGDVIELSFLGIPAIIAINASSQNQRIGDMLADTFVVSTEGRCKFCGEEVTLSGKEALFRQWRCPRCHEFNGGTPVELMQKEA